MEQWIPFIWLGLAIVFAVIEAITLGLATVWFAIGALVALLAAVFGLNIFLQIVLFLVSSVLLLIYTRPIAEKYLKLGFQKTNADSLIGKEGIVIKKIDKYTAGQVKVWGQVWTAVSKNEREIEKGKDVIVEGIEGVKLIVKLKEDV